MYCFSHVNCLGKLDAPSNISAIMYNITFNISWIRPFALDGISVTYSVKTTGMNESGEETLRLVHATDDEMISFEYAESNTYPAYNTCVNAVTEAGDGQPGCADVDVMEG